MTISRSIALGFAASHSAIGLAGTLFPALYGRPWLGDRARDPATRAALRGLAACDGLIALLVVDAVVRDRPLRARLMAGVASDLARASAGITARSHGPRAGVAAMVGASVVGATIATALLPHVDD